MPMVIPDILPILPIARSKDFCHLNLNKYISSIDYFIFSAFVFKNRYAFRYVQVIMIVAVQIPNIIIHK